ncbi:MAG: LptE family protein [Verrucomicrobiae bacterium]|nr:LptE family protein [Verrucomicrobiae bacterium]
MNRAAVRFLALWSLSVAAFVSMTGCAGYQVGPVKPTAYQNIQRIHVPTFKNATLEPRSAAIVTNSVIKQLQQDGTYEITSKEKADAVLVGKITRIDRRQLRAAQTDTLKTTEMSLYIVVEWSLVDPSTGAKLQYAEARDLDETNVEVIGNLRSRPGRVVGQTIQFLDPNFQLSERNAIPLAAEDAAKQLVGQLANGW